MTIGFVLIRPQTRCAPLPLVGRGWGWGSVLGHARRATTTTPTPPAFAALRRATLPARGRVRPSVRLAVLPSHTSQSAEAAGDVVLGAPIGRRGEHLARGV